MPVVELPKTNFYDLGYALGTSNGTDSDKVTVSNRLNFIVSDHESSLQVSGGISEFRSRVPQPEPRYRIVGLGVQLEYCCTTGNES